MTPDLLEIENLRLLTAQINAALERGELPSPDVLDQMDVIRYVKWMSYGNESRRVAEEAGITEKELFRRCLSATSPAWKALRIMLCLAKIEMKDELAIDVNQLLHALSGEDPDQLWYNFVATVRAHRYKHPPLRPAEGGQLPLPPPAPAIVNGKLKPWIAKAVDAVIKVINENPHPSHATTAKKSGYAHGTLKAHVHPVLKARGYRYDSDGWCPPESK